MTRKSLESYRQSSGGNLTLLTAIACVPLMLAAGAAIDYANEYSATVDVQSAMDATVLAMASQGAKFSAKSARDFFNANLTNAGITISKFKVSPDASGNLVGSTTATMKNSFMSIVGKSAQEFTVTATAKPRTEVKLSTVTFAITSAKGAYDKDIYFFTRDSSGKILTETNVLQYDYDNSTGAGTKTYTPTVTTPITINVADYASWGIEMVVYEDVSLLGKHINKVIHYSDDLDAHKWTKTTGACNSAVGQTNNWEDGGDSDFMDFVFKLTCTNTSALSGDVRLTN